LNSSQEICNAHTARGEATDIRVAIACPKGLAVELKQTDQRRHDGDLRNGSLCNAFIKRKSRERDDDVAALGSDDIY
jgi:hypothetical protein